MKSSFNRTLKEAKAKSAAKKELNGKIISKKEMRELIKQKFDILNNHRKARKHQ
jgi:hypothetical protein